ncbi:sugar phosphate isomerase/epimerase [Lachnospiraceae bacterium OttesenSCG-928-D06]|nr:sugar phosphate isomerase/epimerase [Lachnospiraceae bacterium OttesenSCG-928-D06]
MKCGVNLFGTAKWLSDDFSQDLKLFKEISVTSIEPCVLFSTGQQKYQPEELNEEMKARFQIMKRVIWDADEAAEKIQQIKDAGLSINSVHIFGVDSKEDLMDNMNKITNFGKENEIKYFVISFYHGTKEYVEEMFPGLNALAKALKEEGMMLLYHNHETEVRKEQGVILLDYILENCQDVNLELDIGWAQYGGMNLSKDMKKYIDRIELLHLKDYNKEFTPADGKDFFTQIGEGDLCLEDALMECPKDFFEKDAIIFDQDDGKENIFIDLEIGIKNVKKLYQQRIDS